MATTYLQQQLTNKQCYFSAQRSPQMMLKHRSAETGGLVTEHNSVMNAAAKWGSVKGKVRRNKNKRLLRKWCGKVATEETERKQLNE